MTFEAAFEKFEVVDATGTNTCIALCLFVVAHVVVVVLQLFSIYIYMCHCCCLNVIVNSQHLLSIGYTNPPLVVWLHLCSTSSHPFGCTSHIQSLSRRSFMTWSGLWTLLPNPYHTGVVPLPFLHLLAEYIYIYIIFIFIFFIFFTSLATTIKIKYK